jgi:prepilin-type N-terminal cleavage/methylation domain-containing protein
MSLRMLSGRGHGGDGCRMTGGPSARPWAGADERLCAVARCSRGFTLVEIMIVVAVIAIAFAIGAPSFVQVVQKGPMRQAISDVVEALGQARAQAILRGVPVEFVLSGEGEMQVRPARQRHGALKPARLADAEIAEPTEASAGIAFSARLGEDIAIWLLEVNFRDQMDASEARVRFYPNGTSDDFTIVLEFGLERRRIWLDPITALVELETLR